MIRLTIPVKIAEKINKVTKQLYCNYRTYVLKNYTDPHIVYVCGNSESYASSVVFPAFKLDSRLSIFIFTRVDENANLIGAYIIPKSAFTNKNLKWKVKTFKNNNTIEFAQLIYADFEKYNDSKLIELVNNYLNK